MIQGSKAQLAVECDGDYWHGPERYEADLARQRQLERCGWQFFRIRECLYYADADKALAPLWPLLERMGIYPAAQDRANPNKKDEELSNLPSRSQVYSTCIIIP